MQSRNYQAFYALETTEEALQATVHYLAQQMQPFLEENEPVLICFPDLGEKSLGNLFYRAAERCGAEPISWGPDYRWKQLLKLAFESKAKTVIGHPLILLGLMKLARATSTPLYIYDVVMGGYPYTRWMMDGLKKGFDCRIWGCYSLLSGPIVTGFTCEQEAGFHIRGDICRGITLNDQGQPVFAPDRGRLYFVSRKDPQIVYDPEETAVMQYQPCSCGQESFRIRYAQYIGQDDPSRVVLEEQFLAWSSVLDYRTVQTESGISLELVVFPGENLPKLPSCARLNLRFWNPEEDIPFYIQDNFMKIPENNREDH